MKQRRALTHVGGEARVRGDAALGAALARALDVPPAPSGEHEEGLERAHVHGFHAYPARLHPKTAARLVDLAPGPLVLDPFCGSGTVLVEAMIAGFRASGVDLNPLAVRLARAKTRLRGEQELGALVLAAGRARARADERRTARAGATRRYGEEDVRLFEPHVLLELDGLAAGIREEKDARAREDLELALSAILVKVSHKESDTARGRAQKRIAAGYTAKLFFRKVEELARRARDFARLVPEGTPPARVQEGDATRLDRLQPGVVDAIVTSPPYAATYDYVEHHAARLRWLGLDARALGAGELGSRRRYDGLEVEQARQVWLGELGAFFRSARRVLRPGGLVAMVVADSGVRGGALRADELVVMAAGRAELAFVASASQRRPHFHSRGHTAFRRASRAEHAILLRRS